LNFAAKFLHLKFRPAKSHASRVNLTHFILALILNSDNSKNDKNVVIVRKISKVVGATPL